MANEVYLHCIRALGRHICSHLRLWLKRCISSYQGILAAVYAANRACVYALVVDSDFHREAKNSASGCFNTVGNRPSNIQKDLMLGSLDEFSVAQKRLRIGGDQSSNSAQ